MENRDIDIQTTKKTDADKQMTKATDAEKRIPCEIIEDLLPSYIDQLTSEVTSGHIKNHLDSCQQCSEKYERMSAPVGASEEESHKEAQTIDYLKKTKKNTRNKILIWALVIAIAAIAIVTSRSLIMGSVMNPDYIACNIEVEDQDLRVWGSATSKASVKDIWVTESEGVVEITLIGVEKALIYKGSFSQSFTASQEITQVWLGDRIIWANGESISAMTANLYKVRNPYIGNLPADGAVVNALNMGGFTGAFKNELQTSQEPYGWTMIMQNDYSASREDAFRQRLTFYAYAILADIENLGEVTYKYTVEGQDRSFTVTAADASAFAGEDIKQVGSDINKLEHLLQDTGLLYYVVGVEAVNTNAQVSPGNDDQANNENGELTGQENADQVDKVIDIVVVNEADDQVSGMGVHLDVGGCRASQSCINAGGSSFGKGENVVFELIPADFSKDIEAGSKGEITLDVLDKNGNSTEVAGLVFMDFHYGSAYRVFLSGDAEKGYMLGN